jgi:DNA invertase Pin-like site-specific DNA recombinase
MMIGYARVSKTDQNLALQITALEKAGCQKIYTDMASGRSHANPGLKKAKRALKKGDTLVAWSLDRLGRTMKGLIDLCYLLNHKGVHLKFVIEELDTSTPNGRFIFNVKAATAVYELERNTERTLAGLAAARAEGRIGGRKKVMTREKCEKAKSLLDSGMLAKHVAQNLGVSTTSVYRYASSSSIH